MRSLVFLLCIGTLALGEHRNHGSGRRRNMLDLNRTPRRELTENAENLFETVDNDDACDLRGNWYNQHGSELILNQTDDGKLTGEFRTSTRLTPRPQNPEYTEQRQSFAQVRGEIFGKIFTFHVYWREKNALTTWSGQCQRACDFGYLRSERDILHASWLITSSTPRCEDYWSATRIGEDIFTRLPMKAGPRRTDDVAVETA